MNRKQSAQITQRTGLKWVLVISLLFGELLVHTWVRTETTQTTLEISFAQSRLSDLLSYQKELTLERDRLKSDDRIIHIARSQLGLTADVFNQTIYLKMDRSQ
ncbi:MAG: cell division protein FtsL [Desulfotignum sp.]|nr:cell division protein FtsL [Desulfotignum sp.]MCF8124678.1 cell division protein FtsL [Desulfotignum sp.]